MHWSVLSSGSNVRITRQRVGRFETYQSVHGVGQLWDGHSAALFNKPRDCLVLGSRDADKLASVVNDARQPTFSLQRLHAINCILSPSKHSLLPSIRSTHHHQWKHIRKRVSFKNMSVPNKSVFLSTCEISMLISNSLALWPIFVLMAVFQMDRSQLPPSVFILHLFERRTFGDDWHGFFMGWMSLPPNQQYQRT